MTNAAVPRIFSPRRRALRIVRALMRQNKTDPAQFVWDDMAEDAVERLSFVQHQPERSLVLGACPVPLAAMLNAGSFDHQSGVDFDIETPFPRSGYDFIAVIGLLDAVNDLPGALIHLRNALKPGGLVIASFMGGASLTRLRGAMLAADGDKPAARMHPMVDPRAAPQLLQRAGWKDPVVDTHTLNVRYSSLDQLVHDLRDHGLGSALADTAPPLGKSAFKRARTAFLGHAEDDGKVTETFDILTLTGRRSLAGT